VCCLKGGDKKNDRTLTIASIAQTLVSFFSKKPYLPPVTRGKKSNRYGRRTDRNNASAHKLQKRMAKAG